MPLSIFSTLNARKLKETGVVIQLADKSVVYPKGVLEDVLVQVNNLVFPTNFYVLDMEDGNSEKQCDILLGRPFLSTAKTKIDVYEEKSKENLDSDEVQEEVVYELEALKPKLGDPTPHDLTSSHTNIFPPVMEELEIKEYKEAVAHVKDLSLSTCMQRNHLGVNYDPIQEVQRHLNPPRMILAYPLVCKEIILE
ncbi:DNA-directed DNA polymerase [Senna tora]|uniref:DNA-directed DNA polymerase n=1 Tax=Senna tora TaxID=362788 RepID=A0A834T0U0_9FABA|nr:DNA-directed DNA polymerase [Senna tora]